LGLLHGKKATVITSSGWLYRNGSPLAACNHQEPWIRMILAFIGVTSVDFFVADGLAEIDRGKRDREQYLRPIREEVQRKAGRRFGNCASSLSDGITGSALVLVRSSSLVNESSH